MSTATPAARPKSAPAIVTRALSINEPWAWLIVAGGPSRPPGLAWKPIENRSWPTSYRGPVAIHASTSKRHLNASVEDFICDAHPQIEVLLQDKRIDKHNQLFHFGAIIGVVDIVGCVDLESCYGDFDAGAKAAGLGEWLAKFQAPPAAYWAEGRYCFCLDNPRQFTQPIPAKGKLNIYSLSPAEIAAVSKALAAPLGSPVEYRAKLAAAGKAAKSAGKPAAKK